MKINYEEINSNQFEKYREESYPHVIHMYNYQEDYYTDVSFEEKTAGQGTTRTFRKFLSDFIERFESEPFYEGSPYCLSLTPDGEFVVINEKSECPALSESEKTIYHYLCFLQTARFWQEFEHMRDLNHKNKPLIIKDFVERLDQSVDINELILKAKGLGRKVVLII